MPNTSGSTRSHTIPKADFEYVAFTSFTTRRYAIYGDSIIPRAIARSTLGKAAAEELAEYVCSC